MKKLLEIRNKNKGKVEKLWKQIEHAEKINKIHTILCIMWVYQKKLTEWVLATMQKKNQFFDWLDKLPD